MGPHKHSSFAPRLTLGLFLSFAAVGACSAQVFLDLPPIYATAANAYAVAIADLNGDGRLDLVTANSGATISVLLGNGDSTFGAHQDYPIANSSQALVIADFNGDGNPDVATANSFGTTISVLLGNGDGTFQNHVDYEEGRGPTSIVAADFNGDGKNDLAVNNRSVNILLGRGDGTFQPARSVSISGDTAGLAAGDLNHDGKADLVTSNLFDAVVVLGNGDGTFQPEQDFETGLGPVVVTLGDLNGDHNLDVITGNTQCCGESISVLLGNGDGTLQAHREYFVTSPTFVTTGDLNHDGKLDVVAVTTYYSDTVSVFFGNGDGTLQNRTDYAASAFPYGIAIGDFNGDGKEDMAVASEDGVAILSQQGRNGFAVRADYATPDFPNGIAVADFNGDGRPDLVTANYFYTASVLFQDANGAFRQRMDFDASFDSTTVVTADFNGDGNPDFAAGDGSNGVAIFLGNGDGTFQSKVDYPDGGSFLSPLVADFNNDGKLDLAAAGVVLLGNGDGSFSLPIDFTADSASFIAAGDFNHDGNLDIVAPTPGHGFSLLNILLGNGDGTFQPAAPVTIRRGAATVFAGDFNHDGNLDAAIGHGALGFAGISLLLGNGDGTFQSPALFTDIGDGELVNTADINGDRNLDLIVAAPFSVDGDRVTIMFGNGDGTFQPGVNTEAASAPSTTAVADFNHDGAPDLAVSNGSSTDTVSIFLNLGGSHVRATSQPNPSKAGQTVTFVIQVTPTFPGRPSPTGTITLNDGGQTLAVIRLQPARTYFRTSKLSLGTHTITLEYSGDSNYNPNTAPPITQVVNP